MYRESLLGTALSATLEEVAPHLNEGQREHLWRVFDATMEECLEGVPVMNRVLVKVPPVSLELDQLGLQRSSDFSTLVTTETYSVDPLASSSPTAEKSSSDAVQELASVINNPQATFPVYRCVDGLWTILLKDPEVSVRDEYGQEETFHLDYLRMYLKEMSGSGAEAKGKKRGRGVKRPRG